MKKSQLRQIIKEELDRALEKSWPLQSISYQDIEPYMIDRGRFGKHVSIPSEPGMSLQISKESDFDYWKKKMARYGDEGALSYKAGRFQIVGNPEWDKSYSSLAKAMSGEYGRGRGAWTGD